MNAGDWLAGRARITPGKVALVVTPDALAPDAGPEPEPLAGHGQPPARGGIDGARRYTYRDLDVRALRLAAVLRGMGVGKGDRVAVLAPNGVVHVDTMFACAKLGAVFVPLNVRLALGELRETLLDAAPAVLLYDQGLAGTAAALKESVPSLQYLLDTGRGYVEAIGAVPDTGGVAVDVNLDDPWMLLYTGGTTGKSKGAIITHRQVLFNAINTQVSWGLRPDDIAPIITPMFHTGGLNVFATPLFHLGGTMVLTGPFRPAPFLDVIAREGLTVIFMVPSMFQSLAQDPGFSHADFSSVRFFISGGAPCPRPVIETYWAKGVMFKTGYGLTEVGPNCFAMPDELARQRPGYVGFPVVHSEMKLVDDDGNEISGEGTGELCIRGPHVTAGYWHKPDATREVLVDGWFHTGDIARRDADGCYAIVDRKKDMFISGGENVYPLEIETVLYTHPAVAECAVVGVPDDRWGEVGKAVVVLRPGMAATSEELITYLRERLAHYKVPKYVEFRDELPRNAAGKVLKRSLR